MADDWSWFWASDSGRDRMLRDEIDYLQSSARSASGQSARLSSQLAALQGSMESRLTALSTAFDAYVELGDVREQLAAFPEAGAVRRDAVLAVDGLRAGRTVAPIADRGLGYWLSYAVNALIARLSGTPDATSEQRASELAPESQWFLVAAAGALGRGRDVADQVPTLLTCDGRLSSRQDALWTAVVGGVYGDDVLPALRPYWAAMIETDSASWVTWTQQQARAATAVATLRWLDDELGPAGGPPAPTADPAPEPLTSLQSAVTELITAGSAAEASLITRSHELRALVEHPERALALRPEEAPGRSVTDAVRAGWLDASAGSAVRVELQSWLAGPLREAADLLDAQAQQAPAEPARAQISGADLDVWPAGADPGRLARLDETLQQTYAPTLAPLLVRAVAGALLLAGVIGSLASGETGLAVFLGVGLVVAAALAWVEVRRRRDTLTRLGTARTDAATRVAEAQQLAATFERLRLEQQAEATARRDSVRRHLGPAEPQAGG